MDWTWAGAICSFFYQPYVLFLIKRPRTPSIVLVPVTDSHCISRKVLLETTGARRSPLRHSLRTCGCFLAGAAPQESDRNQCSSSDGAPPGVSITQPSKTLLLRVQRGRRSARGQRDAQRFACLIRLCWMSLKRVSSVFGFILCTLKAWAASSWRFGWCSWRFLSRAAAVGGVEGAGPGNTVKST